ncbi:MAG: selenocysteine-specific translation elongation factor, partial [Myxococcota bacterium]
MTERTADASPLILGTAGHIDHGKTTLVRALSGVDCDRLPEEKERGITIELGFAPLDLPSGRRLGIVDVPGHERLVRTMVAGACGIDLVLFVVAADEGIMPQSREHLAICNLLGIDRGVVALTKVDLVDPELAELARLEVEEELARAVLAGSPIVPVSAQTGEGIERLRTALDSASARATGRTLRDGPAWLPVDRVFTMRGFGTVVTGTLRGNVLEEGQTLEVFPDRAHDPLVARVRGLQVHGAATKRASPGSRCAVNLQGVERSQVPRGSVLAEPGRVGYRPRLEVELQLLPAAPALASGATLTVHIGTAERLGRVRLLDRPRLEPGESAFAELRFEIPIVAVEGDRFIVRGFSRLENAGWTIGGGRILDVAPHRRQRRGERVRDLGEIASGSAVEALAVRLRRAGPAGIRERDLRRSVRTLEAIPGVRIGSDLWLDREIFDEIVDDVRRAVEVHHRDHPEDAWVGLAQISRIVGGRLPDETIRAALDQAVSGGALEAESSGVRVPGHTPRAGDPALSAALERAIVAGGLGPPLLDHLTR